MSKDEQQPKRNGGGGGGGPHGRMPAEKPKDFKQTMIKLGQFLAPFKTLLIVIVILTIASAMFTVVGPTILGDAITVIFTGAYSPAGIDFDLLLNKVMLLTGLYLLSLAFSIFNGFIITKIAQQLAYNLRKSVSEKIDRTPLKYYDTHSTGDILSRITNDVDTISNSLNQSLPQILNAIVTIVGVTIMMLRLNVTMSFIVLGVAPLSMISVIFIIKKSQSYFKEQQASLGRVNGTIEETFGGLQLVQSFNHEDENFAEFKQYNDSLKVNAKKAQFISSIMMPMMDFITNIVYVVVAVVGAYFASRNVIQVGTILSFVQYTRNFMQPISQVSQSATILQSTAAAAERVFEFLEEEEEPATTQELVNLDDIRGDVTFDHINFGYEEGKTIINDFSIDLKAGSKVAIVGPTGAGKTTLLKLLMRFYDLDGGKIMIDEKNINDYNRQQLRSMFGIVLQDTWLFNGSIRDNIEFGKKGATDEEIIAACKAAHVHHYIKTLPGGYDAILNEESSNISQGQKQLLTIARAIISDPKIMIFDEATSSVDTRTEKLIQEATNNLLHNRTSFVIAHRLSTILDSDLILVMNKGDIIEQGTHQELMEANGFYADLYNSQFGA